MASFPERIRPVKQAINQASSLSGRQPRTPWWSFLARLLSLVLGVAGWLLYWPAVALLTLSDCCRASVHEARLRRANLDLHGG